jgi:hypothetical protein
MEQRIGPQRSLERVAFPQHSQDGFEEVPIFMRNAIFSRLRAWTFSRPSKASTSSAVPFWETNSQLEVSCLLGLSTTSKATGGTAAINFSFFATWTGN